MNLPVPRAEAEWAALRRAGIFLVAQEKYWAGRRSPACWGIVPCAEILTRRPMAIPIRKVHRLRLPHFAPKAKRAIYLFMSGGPSQVDLFDYKPHLTDLYDKDIPDSVRAPSS